MSKWETFSKRLRSLGWDDDKIDAEARPYFFDLTIKQRGITDPDEILRLREKFIPDEDRTGGGLARGARKFSSELIGGIGDFLRAAPSPTAPGASLIMPEQKETIGKIAEAAAPRGPAITRGEKIGEGVGGVAGALATDLPYFAAGTAMAGPIAGPSLGFAASTAAADRDKLLSGEMTPVEVMRDIAGSGLEGAAFGPAAKWAARARTFPGRLIQGAAAGAGVMGAGSAMRGEDPLHGAGLGAGLGAATNILTRGKIRGTLPEGNPKLMKRIEAEIASRGEQLEGGVKKAVGRKSGQKPPEFPVNRDLVSPGTNQFIDDQLTVVKGMGPKKMSVEDMVAAAESAGRADVAMELRAAGPGIEAGKSLIAGREFDAAATQATEIRARMRAASDAGDEEAAAALAVQYDDLANNTMAALGKWIGYGTEAARQLGIRNAMKRDLPLSEQAMIYMKRRGTLNRQSFDALTKATSDSEIRAIAKTSWEPTMWDKFYEGWLMGLLSHPLTWGPTGVNTISNAAKDVLLHYPVRGAQIWVDRAVSFGKGTKRSYTAGDFFSEVQADMKASRAAAKQWWHDILHDSDRSMGKLEVKHGKAIGGQVDASATEKAAGYFARTPGRFLEATDQFFRSKAQARELRLIARERLGRGKTIDEYDKFAAEIIDDPKKYASEIRRMRAAGDEAVFTTPLVHQAGHSNIAYLANMIQDLKKGDTLAAKGAQLIFPFTRTPANIAIDAIKHSPFGLMELSRLQSKRDAMIAAAKAAGASPQHLAEMTRRTQQDITEQVAKIAVGSGLFGTVAYHAANGDITGGGPVDYKKYVDWIEAGNQPYSFKIGDKWVSYQRIEPFASIMGMAADMVETGKAPPEEKAGRAWAAMKDNLANKTFLLGMENLTQAWANPKRYGEQFIRSFSSTFVPGASLAGGIARMVDPVSRIHTGEGDTGPERFASSVERAIQGKIPGARNLLEERRDITGKQIVDEYPVSNFLLPFRSSPSEPSSKVIAEISRLDAAGFDVPSPQRRKRTVRGQNKLVRTTTEEYSEFHASNARAAAALGKIMAQPSYNTLSDEAKSKIISGVYRKYGSLASARVRSKMRKRLQ
jgi:hypothetical protein